MTSRYPRTFPADEASSWRRIRRYAVPRWMIERATERRMAGDWRGACEAANVDVTFTLAQTRQYGELVADMVEDDLRYFAPDLLRWHLPRVARYRTTLRCDQVVILAGYGDRESGGPYLYATTPPATRQAQRVALHFGWIGRDEYSPGFPGTAGSMQYWGTMRHLWDVRRAGDLRERCGGTDRAPFANRNGTTRDIASLPVRNPGPGDPAGHAEWTCLLHDRGETGQAFTAAGVALDTAPLWMPSGGPELPLAILALYPLALTRLEPEVRQLVRAGFGERFQIPRGRTVILVEPGSNGQSQNGLRVQLAASKDVAKVPPLPEAAWRRLPDLDLLRCGDITPEQLHPLVSASLFPGRIAKAGDGPPEPALPAPVRVRCHGEWHEVHNTSGRLQVPHSGREKRREQALAALGGPIVRCLAVEEAWSSGKGWLPKALREQRRELFNRAQQGDTPGVLQLLDAGFGPQVKDGHGRGLLHRLHLLDHEVLLPRLLNAGLDLEARDSRGLTPLHVAVSEGGSAELVQALLAAGAKNRRGGLRFLVDRIVAKRPPMGSR